MGVADSFRRTDRHRHSLKIAFLGGLKIQSIKMDRVYSLFFLLLFLRYSTIFLLFCRPTSIEILFGFVDLTVEIFLHKHNKGTSLGVDLGSYLTSYERTAQNAENPMLKVSAAHIHDQALFRRAKLNVFAPLAGWAVRAPGRGGQWERRGQL